LRAFAFVVLCVVLAGCNTAQLIMSDAETTQGSLNLSNVQLGDVFVWDIDNKQISRVALLDRPKAELKEANIGYNVKSSVNGGVEFVGDIRLPQTSIDAIEIEAARRSSFQTRNLQRVAIIRPITSLVREIRENPAELNEALEISRVIESQGKLLYVIVSEVGLSESTELTTDNRSAVGAKFDVKGLSGGLKFKIIDAGELEFTGRNGGLAPTFVRYTIIQPQRDKENGLVFSTVTSADTANLRSLIRKGNY
jgi:hypothetical protein